MTLAGPIAELYQEHRQALFSLALSTLRDPAAAEDAVHDAVSRLLTRKQAPQGDPVAYLFASVRNAARDLARRRRVRQSEEPPASLFDPAAQDPAFSASDAEAYHQLREAIDALPEEQREVLLMRAIGRLGFEQIATITATPLGTVASRYARGVQALRSKVQEVKS